MNCPKCRAPMTSATRVYNGNTVTEEVFYCPKCSYRHVRRRSMKNVLAGLLTLGLLAGGPCSRDYSLFRIGSGQPVIQNPDANMEQT